MSKQRKKAGDPNFLAKWQAVLDSLPKPERRKRIAERVKWSPLDSGLSYEAQHGTIKIDLNKNCGHEWHVECESLGVSECFPATSVSQAKAEALRIVQATVMELFEAWRD